MSSVLLFDISAIDLTRIVVSPDEVGRINPQCGAMRLLDHVIHINAEKAESLGVKHVTHDEFWVPLHIPGRPLMPGVLMIEAAAQLASVMFSKRYPAAGFMGFTRCTDTAFRGQVVPGDNLYLLAQAVTLGARRFVTRGQGVVNGRLVFETTISGMRM